MVDLGQKRWEKSHLFYYNTFKLKKRSFNRIFIAIHPDY